MLTDTAIKSAAARAKPYKMSDAGGLFLLVNPSGSRLWRLKYRFAGKEKILALGPYPQVGLRAARDARDDARKKLREGVDPSAERREAKAAAIQAEQNSLAEVAHRWYAKKVQNKSKSLQVVTTRLLERDILPALGKRPIDKITRRDLLAVVHKIEEVQSSGRGGDRKGGPAIARTAVGLLHGLFQYAQDVGLIELSPAQRLSSPLEAQPESKSHAAATTPESLAEVIRKIDAIDSGWIPARVALKVQVRMFLRPTELLSARWEDVNLEAGIWTVRRTKVKGTDTVTRIPRQVVVLLQQLEPFADRSGLLFPAQYADKMDREVLTKLLRSAGIGAELQTVHGFRATARTMLNEVLGFRGELLEHQLGHVVKGSVARAYQRMTFLEERSAMLQSWADYLDDLRDGVEGDNKIVPIRRGATG